MQIVYTNRQVCILWEKCTNRVHYPSSLRFKVKIHKSCTLIVKFAFYGKNAQIVYTNRQVCILWEKCTNRVHYSSSLRFKGKIHLNKPHYSRSCEYLSVIYDTRAQLYTFNINEKNVY